MLSVRGRLFAFCIGLLLLLGASNLLLGYLIEQGPEYQQLQQEQYRRFEVISSAQEAMGIYRNRYGLLNGALVAGDIKSANAIREGLPALREQLDRNLSQMQSFDVSGVSKVHELLRGAEETVPVLHAALIKRDQSATEGLSLRLREYMLTIEELFSAANLRERERAEQVQEEARAQAAFGVRWSRLIIVCAAAVGLLLAIVVVQSIIRPLYATTLAIRSVNAGETEIDLPPDSKDEFGDMAVALRQFRDQAERLRQLAYYDPLTGLGNRAQSEESLRRAIDQARASGKSLALLYLDLDNFRAINDSLSHSAGDQYLC